MLWVFSGARPREPWLPLQEPLVMQKPVHQTPPLSPYLFLCISLSPSLPLSVVHLWFKCNLNSKHDCVHYLLNIYKAKTAEDSELQRFPKKDWTLSLVLRILLKTKILQPTFQKKGQNQRCCGM